MTTENNVNQIMNTTLEKIRTMVDVDTIIGNTIVISETISIIPISKVTFGFFSGGGEYEFHNKNKESELELPFAGGGSAGVTINPIGFLVANKDRVTLLPVNHNSTIETIIEMIPNVITDIKNSIKN